MSTSKVMGKKSKKEASRPVSRDLDREQKSRRPKLHTHIRSAEHAERHEFQKKPDVFSVGIGGFGLSDIQIDIKKGWRRAVYFRVDFDNYKQFSTSKYDMDNPNKTPIPTTRFLYKTRFVEELQFKYLTIVCLRTARKGPDKAIGLCRVDLDTLASGAIHHDIPLVNEGRNLVPARIKFNVEFTHLAPVNFDVNHLIVQGLKLPADHPKPKKAKIYAEISFWSPLVEKSRQFHHTIPVESPENAKWMNDELPNIDAPAALHALLTGSLRITIRDASLHKKVTTKDVKKAGVTTKHQSSGSSDVLAAAEVLIGRVYDDVEVARKGTLGIKFKQPMVLRRKNLPGVTIQGVVRMSNLPKFAQLMGGVHTERGTEGGQRVCHGIPRPSVVPWLDENPVVWHDMKMEHTVPLPPGWEEMKDEGSNRTYYVDHNTQRTSWIRPTASSISSHERTLEIKESFRLQIDRSVPKKPAAPGADKASEPAKSKPKELDKVKERNRALKAKTLEKRETMKAMPTREEMLRARDQKKVPDASKSAPRSKHHEVLPDFSNLPPMEEPKAKPKLRMGISVYQVAGLEEPVRAPSDEITTPITPRAMGHERKHSAGDCDGCDIHDFAQTYAPYVPPGTMYVTHGQAPPLAMNQLMESIREFEHVPQPADFVDPRGAIDASMAGAIAEEYDYEPPPAYAEEDPLAAPSRPLMEQAPVLRQQNPGYDELAPGMIAADPEPARSPEGSSSDETSQLENFGYLSAILAVSDSDSDSDDDEDDDSHFGSGSDSDSAPPPYEP